MANDKDGDYEVGYARPPKQMRFQSGQSGNPKGRPRGAKNLTILLGQALSERVLVTENGRRRSLSKLAAACKQLVNRALSGDLRAMKLLLELVRAIESKTLQAAVEDTALTEEIDQEIIRQLRDRLRRMAQDESDQKEESNKDEETSSE
jgi:hypothetical protein